MVKKDRVFVDAIKDYKPAEIQEDQNNHDTEIEHMYYLDKLKHLIVMERDSKRFKVYNSKTGQMIANAPQGKNARTGGAFIAADYIEYDNSTKYVATSSSNNIINLWDPNNYMWKDRINTHDIQLCLKWCGGNVNRLFTAGLDKHINCIDIVKVKETSSKDGYTAKKDQDLHHNQYIVDLLPIPKRGFLASAGFDKKICLWHLDTLKPVHVLSGTGYPVTCLDWFADQNLILSAGLDHDVTIWNPMVQSKIFVLKGHNHSIVGVKWIPNTNQIISADISGVIRVWDVRNFSTVQTLKAPLNEINSLAVTYPPKRIVVGGRKLCFFEYDEPKDHHLADDVACLQVLYNPVFYTFITAHPTCVKIWDASNGCLQSVYRNISTADITSLCLDQRQRKLFVGD